MPKYVPAAVPARVEGLQSFLSLEFNNVAAATNVPEVDALYFAKLGVAPPKPRDGQVVYADGTSWNPGGGEGFYGYYAGAWNRLG